MVTLQRTRSGEPTPAGIGWRVSHDSGGRRYLHHGGASNGGRACLLVYPAERLVVAVAGNALADWGEREALAVAQIMIARRGAGASRH
jgi:CubicO group peptidase (beta-lactamase class C family)